MERTFEPAGAGLEPRNCRNCGAEFTPRRKWAEFCCIECKNDYHAARRKAASEALDEKLAKNEK